MEKEKTQEIISNLFDRLDADGKLAMLAVSTCLLDGCGLCDWMNNRLNELAKELLSGNIKPNSSNDSLAVAYLLEITKNC